MPSLKPSRLHKPYYRNGDNHRSGADVSFTDIQRLFGFRTIQVGRWVSATEQQLAANLFFDALCDLADILQVPEPVISLNNTLSLVFGSGGQKYASAHYNAKTRQLALAKNAGGGALAHEWFHAFDHYIARKTFADAKAYEFASQCWLDNRSPVEHPLNQYLFTVFEALFIEQNETFAGQSSDYFRRAVAIDKSLGGYYFAQPPELAARAFESVIQSGAIKNHFLASGTLQSAEAKMGAYPNVAERENISKKLFRYFHYLGQGVSKQLQSAHSSSPNTPSIEQKV
ncbi:CLCA_X family protein [Alteromonas oceanisediminis]|uniref:CLCA_X family protein n=1 Tax=Alteromonas oceanisediminis TaxID=2836180 RepID=UPI001BD925B9|nr:CLCA_X family protein [Alteromonas oceanisediminis]MBT0585884.1 hypothetical protein [Alteromonas oceanisediminis]